MKRFGSCLLAFIALLSCSLAFGASQQVLVVGHKNPDTDAIISAIAVAHLKTQLGVAALPIAQGLPTPETKFVLDAFQLTAPAVQTSVAGRQVFLVDHSDYPLAPDDLKQAELVGIVDHHKLGGMTTDKPIEVWVFPVGCSGTIITRMYEASGTPIPKAIAGGMLAAILSDTVVFKSPTTTAEDRAAATKLAKLAGVEDAEAFGIKMFEAKSALKGIPATTLLKQDMKDFRMNDRKVAVAQLEVMDLSTVLSMKSELLDAMAEYKKNGYHSVLLMLTDIMKGSTNLLVVSDDVAVIETAFASKSMEKSVWLPGVMSRKKQVVPVLEQAFK
jgi:manganese-dependent inorganic pyrophosphatase